MPQLQSWRDGDMRHIYKCAVRGLCYSRLQTLCPTEKILILLLHPTFLIKVFGDIKIQMGYHVTSGQLVWLGSTIWSSRIISLQAYAATFPQADILLHASARRQHPLAVMNKSNPLSLTNQVLSVLPTASQTQQKPPTNLPGTGYVFLDSMLLLRFSSVL